MRNLSRRQVAELVNDAATLEFRGFAGARIPKP